MQLTVTTSRTHNPKHSIHILDPARSPSMWAEHDRYQTSIYSCSSYLRAFDLVDGSYIARIASDGVIERSLAYRMRGNSAFVLGALSAPSHIFELLAVHILAENPSVRYVRSDLLVRDLQFESHPQVHLVGRGDDLSCPLPETLRDFDRSLEKDHLKRLKYYERRFARDFPESRIVVLRRDEISPEAFNSVVEFNRTRMSAKGRVPGIDETYERRMLSVVRENGILVLLKNGDELVAGSVLLEASREAFLWAISHNAKYDKFSPGLICLYGGIGCLISNGVRKYHFLWGDSAYKRQFGAVREELAAYCILRRGATRWEVAPLLFSHYKRELRSFAGTRIKALREFARLSLKR